MKHWMAVAAIALIASGVSVANSMRGKQSVITPGLPAGWVADGLIAGRDEVGVSRPPDGSAPELVVSSRGEAAREAARKAPLSVYQTFGAAPWRGRRIVFSAYLRIQLEPEVMRLVGDAAVADIRIECDGAKPVHVAYPIKRRATRQWLENNLALKVPVDATMCTIGAALLAQGEMRLSKARLRQGGDERDIYFARRGFGHQPESSDGVPFAPGVAAAGAIAPLNLELAQ